jgi:hypothetical protein
MAIKDLVLKDNTIYYVSIFIDAKFVKKREAIFVENAIFPQKYFHFNSDKHMVVKFVENFIIAAAW